MERSLLHLARCKLCWHLVLLVIILGKSVIASGANQSVSRVRLSAASDKFDDTTQVAAIFDYRAPAVLRAEHMELAFGSIATSREAEAFVSFGPVWRLAAVKRALFVDFGFSPTLVSGTVFNGRDLGGSFHFTSSLTIGTPLGRDGDSLLALRIQHTSNGGLNSNNPGMDMVGLELAVAFAK